MVRVIVTIMVRHAPWHGVTCAMCASNSTPGVSWRGGGVSDRPPRNQTAGSQGIIAGIPCACQRHLCVSQEDMVLSWRPEGAEFEVVFRDTIQPDSKLAIIIKTTSCRGRAAVAGGPARSPSGRLGGGRAPCCPHAELRPVAGDAAAVRPAL